MGGVKIDGNNLLSVYDTIKGVREYCIEHQKPYLIECATFRMRGHEEASGTKYIPKYLFELWEQKDPVVKYEKYLLEQGVLTEEKVAGIRQAIREEIESELKPGLESSIIFADTDEEINDVYAQRSTGIDQINITATGASDTAGTDRGSLTEKRFVDAISEGLKQSMIRHPNLILMGQDIAEYGGAFKITEGFLKEFGKERVRNTPLCESAIVGAALGLSLEGYKSMMEMQFADFVTVGFNQIVNNLAKIHYRWGQNADVVIRMPTGGGRRCRPLSQPKQ